MYNIFLLSGFGNITKFSHCADVDHWSLWSAAKGSSSSCALAARLLLLKYQLFLLWFLLHCSHFNHTPDIIIIIIITIITIIILLFLAIIVKVSKQYINTSCKNISDNSKSSNSLQWEGASNTTDGGNFDRSFFAAKCEMMLVALQIWNLMLFLLFLYLLTKACLKLELRWWVCQLLNKKCQRSWYFKIF